MDRDLDGLAAGFVQNGRKLQLGGHFPGKVDVQAAGFQGVAQLFHALGIGGFMDAVHKRHMMGAARIGSALVGQQHELFDHAL